MSSSAASPKRPVKSFRGIAFLFLLAAAGLIAFAWISDDTRESAADWPLRIITSEQTHHLTVELALTHKKQKQGLMFRETLAENTGMLFVYEQPQTRAMWMKNTPLSLDMLFVDSDGTIQHIARNTIPYSTRQIIGPNTTQYVLELRAGITRKLGIRRHDRIENLPPANYSPSSS